MINLFGLVSNTTERRTKTEKEKPSPWPIVLTSAKKTPEGYIYKGCFNNYYRRVSRDACVLIFIGASIFLRQKKMGASVWKTWRRKTRRKRDKKKELEKKATTSYVVLMCYLKITFFTVITFWGKLFLRKVLFSSTTLPIFASKIYWWRQSYRCVSWKYVNIEITLTQKRAAKGIQKLTEEPFLLLLTGYRSSKRELVSIATNI